MKRPLAVCGFAFLIASLAACLLPAGLRLPLGAALAAGFAIVFLLRKGNRQNMRRPGGALALLLCAAALAFLWRAGYDAAFVRPAAALAGTERAALARVEDTAPGYGGDTVHATLSVLELDGEKTRPFKVQARGMPEVEIGDLIEVPLRFYTFSNPVTASINGAKGQFVGARAAAPPQKAGESLSFGGRMRLLRYAAGDAIREKLPLRLSSVASAMAVGDKRFLPAQTTEAYRMAGLSHLLVVSGLHLSILSGMVYGIFYALLRKKRPAAVVAAAATLFFVAFTGFTPSVVRSGVAAILMLLGPILRRRADIFTSLGLAALLLCLHNPCAAADAGLLLSFSATLGAIAGGRLAQKLRRGREGGRFFRFLWGVAALGLTSLCVTLATLPAIIWISGGVSLLTVPMNILGVPLLAPIIICGLVMALPGAGPLLLFTRPASLIGGGLLVLLEKLTGFAAAHPKLYLAVGGLFGLAAVLLVYALVFLAYKTRYRKTYLAAAAAMAVFALGLHLALSAGTVRLTVAGSGSASSLVVTKDGRSVVLYRGRLSAAAVKRTLDTQRAGDCALFVDLRKSAQSTEYIDLFAPEEVIVAADEPAAQQVLEPIDGVEIYLKKQGGGTVACVDIDGYKVAVAAGSADLGGYAVADVLVAGGGEVAGEYKTLIVTGALPAWAAGDAEILYSDGMPQILIRPGASVAFREVQLEK